MFLDQKYKRKPTSLGGGEGGGGFIVLLGGSNHGFRLAVGLGGPNRGFTSALLTLIPNPYPPHTFSVDLGGLNRGFMLVVVLGGPNRWFRLALGLGGPKRLRLAAGFQTAANNKGKKMAKKGQTLVKIPPKPFPINS